ncbi:arylsulfatase B-like [Anneissia japonica]|uniref:arylsulfatase B-like n=1 Tax=Anneissia japonica TaxID=1529436 RepID=UPI0014259153|nr:arylsulfatase B-like [Anneissia japonica]
MSLQQNTTGSASSSGAASVSARSNQRSLGSIVQCKHCKGCIIIIDLKIYFTKVVYEMTYCLTYLLLALSSHVYHVIAKPPNIVFILADDYGFHDIGYHGSAIKTPVLDQLAAEGVKLENYYVQPICSPTRSQLMTGKYQIHTGLQHSIIWCPQTSCLPDNDVTIAQRLKSLGYSTHIVGKWHIGFARKKCWPTRKGFDSFFGYLTGQADYYTHVQEGVSMPGFDVPKDWHYGVDMRDNDKAVKSLNGTYGTFIFADKAHDVIMNHNVSKPLFLYMALQAVHAPLQVPDHYKMPYAYMKDSNRSTYAGMVASMDEAVGNLTQSLKKRGLWENTIVVFSTDNGGEIHQGGNNWPLRGWKHSLWEGGIHGVGFISGPLVPKKVQGSVYNGLMHVSDWFPTLVEGVAGGEIHDLKLDGHNMWKSISEGIASPRKEILHNIDPLQPQPYPKISGKQLASGTFDTSIRSAIRVGDWKLITGDPGNSSWIAPPESDIKAPIPTDPKDKTLWLFNIIDDPYEYNDLSELRPDIVNELYQRLVFYANGSLPVNFPPPDVRANPALHDDMWSDWIYDE